MSRRIVNLCALVLPVVLVASISGCRSRRAIKIHGADAGAQTRTRDAAVRPAPRRPEALAGLVAHVPGRASWFVALGRPAELFTGAGRYWKLLAEIPDLSAPMKLIAQRLGKVLGAWPPPATLWQGLGVDPGGGLVLAGVPQTGAKPGGTLALAYTRTPQPLLRRLVGATGGAVAKAALGGSSGWWCGAVTVGVACASSRELLAESRKLVAGASSRNLLTELSMGSWRGVDLAGGWRSGAGKPMTSGVARLRPWGVQAQVRLRGGLLGRWLSWLGPGRAPPPRPRSATASAWLRLDPVRVATLVGLLPAGAIESTATGAEAPGALLRQCTGEVRLVVGAGGWRLQAVRKGTAVGPPKGRRWKLSGWPVWVRAPSDSLVVADSAASALRAAKTPARAVPRPLQALLSRPAAAVLLLPLVDPFEPLRAGDRVRLLAALVGLPAGERALVGLVRGLLTLLGEAGVSVERTPDGALVRLSFATPATGTPAVRREFDGLWRAKWQGGGFFDDRAMARIAVRHAGTPLARLTRSLSGLRLAPRWSRHVTDAMLSLLRRLKGPELSCATLSARLVRCVEPFARLRAPARWREMDNVVLSAHRRRMRASLLEAARRETSALGAHCDRLGGRLENARQVKKCLAADGCAEFARCLVQAFTPKP